MHNQFSPAFRQDPAASEAEAILLRCVHCGFCNATCPTYQLEGNELNGPRGRIYLIKQVLEGQTVSTATQDSLDTCLSCRSCETTCPSGVQFGRLMDIGRALVDAQVQRPWLARLSRKALLTLLPFPQRLHRLVAWTRYLRPWLPKKYQQQLPTGSASPWPIPRHARRILLLDGCVQPALAPQINASAAWVLDALNISAIALPSAGCCGAMSYHLDAQADGLDFMRRLLDQCWPTIESGVEAICMSASGCGSMLKEYGGLLRTDPLYAAKAERFSALCLDLSEILAKEDLSVLPIVPRTIAFQSPCSLQHGQQLQGVVESILLRCGFKLTPVADAHLCCGSAGTYSLLQRKVAKQLRAEKLIQLQPGQPELIATANIGCLWHLQAGTTLPVLHWLELLRAPAAT